MIPTSSEFGNWVRRTIAVCDDRFYHTVWMLANPTDLVSDRDRSRFDWREWRAIDLPRIPEVRQAIFFWDFRMSNVARSGWVSTWRGGLRVYGVRRECGMRNRNIVVREDL